MTPSLQVTHGTWPDGTCCVAVLRSRVRSGCAAAIALSSHYHRTCCTRCVREYRAIHGKCTLHAVPEGFQGIRDHTVAG